MKQKYYFALSILIIILCFSINVFAEEDLFKEIDEHGNLRLGNEYVVIVVNQEEDAHARFAVETTGGAPARDNDENKSLIYGRPIPWASYTTLKIDDEYYVFGGETERRAGRDGEFGDLITGPKVKDNSIYTAYSIQDLKVEQNLQIVRSTTTGLEDSVLIEYTVTNESNAPRELGTRIMLDTMLGENDGAPFRVGEEEITTDTMYLKDNLPDFWQAFDSISNPRVTSQGTFRGPGITPPDRVYLTNWGSLADAVWNDDDFDFEPGREFIRRGEFEIDSAIALHWDTVTLEPGESKKYSTRYGLGGIDIVPGILSLGVTSPAEVSLDAYDSTFPVIAYVENTSEIEAKNVNINIELPDGFTTNNPERNLGNLESGEINQIDWNIGLETNEIPEEIEYKVKVEADNTDSNEAKRTVRFLAPPEIKTELSAKDEFEIKLEQIKPNPFTVKAKITNTGGSNLYFPTAELFLPPELMLAQSEKNSKPLGLIKPNETVNVNWKIRANGAGELPFAVIVEGADDFVKEAADLISVPEVNPLIYIEPVRKKIPDTEDVLLVDIHGTNIRELAKLNLNLNFNDNYLKLNHISPGNIFVKNNEIVLWNYPEISGEENISIQQTLPGEIDNGIIARLHFKVTEDFSKDEFPVNITNIEGLDDDDYKLNINKEVIEFNE